MTDGAWSSAEAIFETNFFRNNPKPFIAIAQELWPGQKYEPTIAHYFIRLLHEKGVLLRCFTQNIDSLESLAGIPMEKVVAAHGNFDSATCVETGKSVPIEDVKAAYMSGDITTLNEKFGTTLVKPDIVFFGHVLPSRPHRF